MTDNSNEIDQAERVRRLQARRAASGRTLVPTAAMSAAMSAEPEAMTPVARTRSAAPRRHHPAAATRWLLGGLSLVSFFTIAGTVAAANVSAVSASAPIVTPVTANVVATTPVPSNAPTAATPGTAASATKANTASASTSTANASNTKTRGS